MSPAADDRAASERARAHWQQAHAEGVPDLFLDHPLIQALISIRAFGTQRSHLVVVADTVRDATQPGARVLSVGCGTAAKERALGRLLPDRRFVCMDFDAHTLERARAQAQAEGLANLEFEVGDFNHIELAPGSFDGVVGLGAIHHVERLEHFWAAVHGALPAGGLVVAQEYVGPSRFQWTPAQIEIGSRLLREQVGPEHKVHHAEVAPFPLDELIALDPSEAVRSADILPTCAAAGFTVAAYHSGGCGLLLPMFMHQMHTFDPRNWSHNELLVRLYAEELHHPVPDCYAMFVATKVPGTIVPTTVTRA